jgi:hypothetical protein
MFLITSRYVLDKADSNDGRDVREVCLKSHDRRDLFVGDNKMMTLIMMIAPTSSYSNGSPVTIMRAMMMLIMMIVPKSVVVIPTDHLSPFKKRSWRVGPICAMIMLIMMIVPTNS